MAHASTSSGPKCWSHTAPVQDCFFPAHIRSSDHGASRTAVHSTNSDRSGVGTICSANPGLGTDLASAKGGGDGSVGLPLARSSAQSGQSRTTLYTAPIPDSLGPALHRTYTPNQLKQTLHASPILVWPEQVPRMV